MRRLPLVVALVLTGCSGVSGADSTAPSADPTSTTSPPAVETTSAETTTTGPPEQCGEIPYTADVLPERVDRDRPAAGDIPQDEYTTIPGTRSDLWFDGDGELAVALVRGALPPEEWPGERGEVSIDGARGVAGPFEDGRWVVAWFEADGDRCDLYFMVFYPPVEASEVEASIESLDRTAG